MYKRGYKPASYLFILFVITVIVELINYFAPRPKKDTVTFVMCCFNPIDYTLFSLYYLQYVTSKLLKRLVKWSIPLFVLYSLIVSQLVYRFNDFPSINIATEGFILFIFYTQLLFNLNDIRPIQFLHNFWISIGILLFFGGAFALICVYPALVGISTTDALMAYGFIIQPLNDVLYFCIVIGLICLIRNKNLSAQLS